MLPNGNEMPWCGGGYPGGWCLFPGCGVYWGARMTKQHRTFVAFGLVAAQLFGGSVVSLAHARERLDAPRHIESATSEQCLVVHDEARCVTCAFTHARATAATATVIIPALPPARLIAPPQVTGLHARAATHSGNARAPPISHS